MVTSDPKTKGKKKEEKSSIMCDYSQNTKLCASHSSNLLFSGTLLLPFALS